MKWLFVTLPLTVLVIITWTSIFDDRPPSDYQRVVCNDSTIIEVDGKRGWNPSSYALESVKEARKNRWSCGITKNDQFVRLDKLNEWQEFNRSLNSDASLKNDECMLKVSNSNPDWAEEDASYFCDKYSWNYERPIFSRCLMATAKGKSVNLIQSSARICTKREETLSTIDWVKWGSWKLKL